MISTFTLHRRAPSLFMQRRALPIATGEFSIAFVLILACISGCASSLTPSKPKPLSQESELTATNHSTPSDPQSPPSVASVVPASFETAEALPSGKAAEEVRPTKLTFEQALLYTLDNHPRLRARRQEVEVARSKLITASLLPNPQLVIDTDTQLSERGPTQISGRVMFTVPTNWKMERTATAAEAGIVEARWAIDSEVYALLAATTDAALEVLYLQEVVELERQITRLAEAAAEIQRNRAQLKGITATQAIAAEISLADTELDQLSSEPQLEDARIRLSRALGFTRPESVSIEGGLAVQPVGDVPLDTLLAEAEAARPELAQAEAAITKSRRDVDAARAKAVPDFQIGPRFRADLSNNNGDRIGFRFNSDLPVFDRKEGDIYGAASNVRVNEARRDEVRLTSQHDVADAYVQLRRIEAALAQYDKRVVPLTQRTEKLLKDAKDLQELDVAAIYNELRRLGEIQRKHLKLRYQHNLIRAHLELLLGRRLNGVAQPPAG
jgi:outer membrane protein, heavy metal efflux system